MAMHWIYPIVAAVFGLIIGSFLNVLIHRGPELWGLTEDQHNRRGNLAQPRSYCPACRSSIPRSQLIPLVSYIILRGRCANCHAAISLRYPIVEFAGAAAATVSVLIFGFTISALLASIFFWLLIALAAIDWETGYLPDALNLPLVVLGLTANGTGIFTPFRDALIGAVIGYGVFWAIAWSFRQLRGIDGLGHGDAKLLAAIGAWVGWLALAPTVFIASLLGLAAVLLAKVRGVAVSRDTPLAFGPALAAAGAIAFVVFAAKP